MAEDVIDAVCHRIKFDKDKLERGELETIEVDSFNLSDFWNQFGAAVQALSNEVTKISFMCGKKPFPKSDEVSSMVQDMFQYYNIMRELYMVLPEEVGETVYKAVTDVVKNIISGLLDFSQSLKDLTEKGAKERLTVTGTFWDACNSVEKLPKNNLLALLKVLEDESALAADAQEELNIVRDANGALPMDTNICGAKTTAKSLLTELDADIKNGTIISETDKIRGNSHSSTNLKVTEEKMQVIDSSTIKSCERENGFSIKGPFTETDYAKLKEWVILKRSWNKPVTLLALQNEINGIDKLLHKIETIPIDPIFEGLTDKEREEKKTRLTNQFLKFLTIKEIFKTEPELLTKDFSEKVDFSEDQSEPSKVGNIQNFNESSKDVTSEKIEESNVIENVASKELLGLTTEEMKQLNDWSIVSQQVKEKSLVLNKQQSLLAKSPSAEGCFEVKNWVDIQIKNKKPPTVETFQADVANVSRKLQTLADTSSGKVLTQKDFYNVKKKKERLRRKVRRLLSVKQLVDTHPEHFLDPLTNEIKVFSNISPGSKGVSFTGENLKHPDFLKGKKNINLTEKAACSHAARERQSLNFSLTLDYTCTSTQVINYYHGKSLVSERSLTDNEIELGSNHGIPPRKIPRTNSFSAIQEYDDINSATLSNFEAKNYSLGNDDLASETGKRTQGDSEDSAQPKVETVLMILPIPAPNLCSMEFIQYYPHLCAAEVLQNIVKRNAVLKADSWKAISEWKDNLNRFNVLLEMDTESLMVLQDHGLKARVTHQYFAELIPFNEPVSK